MLPGTKYPPEELIRVIARRKWLIIVPFLAGLAGFLPLRGLVPELYRSETLIMVIPQRIPDSYVKSTVTAKVEDRLPSISEQILSRSRLERTIVDFDLYQELRARGIMEDVVNRMRGDILVKLEGKDAFRVSYASRDAGTAQKVTERLASLYIEENLRDRENLAENTNQFLEAQLQDSKRRLVEHEQKLEKYRKRYAGELPTQQQPNLQVIQNAQLQLQALNESQNRARERRLIVERQLADAHTVATPPPTPVSVVPTEIIPPTTAEQLEATQARLKVYKLRYLPNHPDVRALERSVRELQARLEEEQRQPKAASASTVSPEEAARQKRIGDLQAELQVIDFQLAAGDREDARLKRTIAEYQAKVDAVPTRESELVELTRDYGTLQETYASLLAKREESKLAANLERRQIGEQFRVLDPASLPERPDNEVKRLAVGALAPLAGLILGLAFVGLVEYRDLTFRREEDVRRVLDMVVLSTIPRIQPPEASRWRRLLARASVWCFGGITAAVLIGRLLA